MAERASAHVLHKAATRQAILDAAIAMMYEHPGATFSHESLAAKTGIAARTIYRHFPTRADLTHALWVRLRDDADIRWPDTEAGMARSVKALFRQFEKHAAFARAAIAAAAATDYATHGSAEGRAAFARSLAGLLDSLPRAHRRRLIAACVAIYSAPFWQMLRDRGQLSAAAAAETASWILKAVIADARRRATRSRSTRSTTGEPRHAATRTVLRASRPGRTHQRAAQHRR